jgi:hypothetical protein
VPRSANLSLGKRKKLAGPLFGEYGVFDGICCAWCVWSTIR